MKQLIRDNSGIAMVMVLAFLTCLSILAIIIVAVAIQEKKAVFNEYTHKRSFYSADAGSEAAVNWLYIQKVPPSVIDGQRHVFVGSDFTQLSDDHGYRFEITYVRKRIRAGWGPQFKDFEYDVISEGASVASSESEVAVRAKRLFKEGY